MKLKWYLLLNSDHSVVSLIFDFHISLLYNGLKNRKIYCAEAYKLAINVHWQYLQCMRCFAPLLGNAKKKGNSHCLTNWRNCKQTKIHLSIRSMSGFLLLRISTSGKEVTVYIVIPSVFSLFCLPKDWQFFIVENFGDNLC